LCSLAPNYTKIYTAGFEELREVTDIRTYRKPGDLIGLLFFFPGKEIRRKIGMGILIMSENLTAFLE
jgi:hypothetical protein